MTSYRIMNDNGDYASVWTISEHFSTVKFDCEDECAISTQEEINDRLTSGNWTKYDSGFTGWQEAVTYHKGEKVIRKKDEVGVITFKLHIDTSEAQASLAELGEMLDGQVLAKIKSFTNGTGHDVFITEGVYKVYRTHEDLPYVCQNEEELLKVMDALITLDEAGSE